MDSLPLLKRPRPLPAFRDEQQCVYAQWQIKGFFYKKNGLPKMALNGMARVQYAELVLSGRIPKFQLKIPLVDVGYVESSLDILDIRGCVFRLLLFGVDNIEVIRDWLRFLVIRQRVPHSLIGKQFEWQTEPVKNDRQLSISKYSPFSCFRCWL